MNRRTQRTRLGKCRPPASSSERGYRRRRSRRSWWRRSGWQRIGHCSRSYRLGRCTRRPRSYCRSRTRGCMRRSARCRCKCPHTRHCTPTAPWRSQPRKYPLLLRCPDLRRSRPHRWRTSHSPSSRRRASRWSPKRQPHRFVVTSWQYLHTDAGFPTPPSRQLGGPARTKGRLKPPTTRACARASQDAHLLGGYPIVFRCDPVFSPAVTHRPRRPSPRHDDASSNQTFRFVGYSRALGRASLRKADGYS